MADRAVGLPIAREGIPFVFGVALPTMLAWMAGWTGAFYFFGGLTCFAAWFFRNPHRTIPQDPDVILSPADGRVIAIEEEFEPRFLKGPSIRISIFLNIFDVHINRVPCAGTIKEIVYQPGQFLAANRPEATIRNEQNAVMIETRDGRKMVCVQVAGLIARRIICWASPGEDVESGERFGLIRFGSRVDLFIPAGSAVHIHKGNKVKGGETILATCSCADPS